MPRHYAVAALLFAAPLTAASAMPVSTFVAKAQVLRNKGPLAMFSSDLGLLTRQIRSDAAELRKQRLAAKAAGQPTAFCPPPSVALSDQEVMAAMEAVPAAERARTDTRQVLLALLAQRFPCRG